MNKAYKYRIYPNQEQKVLLLKTFGCCRFVWNKMLSDKIDYYKEHKTTLFITPTFYKKEYSFLKKVDSLALANVQLQLDSAYKGFYQKKTLFPCYKSKKNSRYSYTTNLVNQNISVFDNKIKLPKLGLIKAVIHRKAPGDWNLKSVTISMDKDETFYASVLYEYQKNINQSAITFSNTIGLDYKSDGLFADSNGHIESMPHYYRLSEKKLAKLQRSHSKKKIGSNNRLKSKNKVAKLSKHVSNQRKDFLHKLSTEITNRYSLICVETLNMKSMSNSGFKNGKSTLDNGYGMFLQMVDYKQKDKGHFLVKVDKWYPSSQLCNCCNHQNPEIKNLLIRNWTCSVCKTEHDRDYNAALNIKKEGYRIYQDTAA
ncbi:MAG: RNA-guided endonuclease TnpB family protein [Lachnospiraceae bacterium]|nr:RNA-guided endonuclease TnpB family protein [Lachnospiraceae bacterium]